MSAAHKAGNKSKMLAAEAWSQLSHDKDGYTRGALQNWHAVF